MNTQTHLLLASTVLMRPAAEGTGRAATWLRNCAILLGALLPDASLFVMWGIARVSGVAESVIWDEWYFSATWQYAGAVTNSLPLFVFLAVSAWLVQSKATAAAYRVLAAALLAAAFAALLHVVTDFPLHHADGHPHFWPLSSWIFVSPVSYWNMDHYAAWWMPIELLLALVCIWFLWWRYHQVLGRAVLVLAGTSYFVVAAYWWVAFA